MKLFQTIIKRITQIVSGGTGVIASETNVGIEQTLRVEATASELNVGMAVDADRFTVQPEQLAPGVAVDLLGVEGTTQEELPVGVELSQVGPTISADALPVDVGVSSEQSASVIGAESFPIAVGADMTLLGVEGEAAKPATDIGLAQSAIGPQMVESQTPAASIIQIKYDLVRRVGANAVTETAVGGRTDWTADADAVGLHNGVQASMTGNALGARGGQLELSYPDALNKSELTITSATLHFYGNTTGTVLNNADVRLLYDVGAGFVLLETITGNADFTVTPKSHDISAALDTWAKHDALRAAVFASAALGETWVARCDAVELELTATRTDTF